MATYPAVIPLVSNGSGVEAGNTNQAAVALTQRTDWLRDQIQASIAGTAIIIRAQAVHGSVINGTPVYFDIGSGTYKPAQAAVDSATFAMAAAAASVEGIASNVSGGTADIVVSGVLLLTTVQWAAAFDTGVFSAGALYLSTTAGKVSSSPGAFGIYIGNLRSNGSIVVRSVNTGPYLQHIHLQRTLLGKPAGTVVDPPLGDPQIITSPDAGQQGWLPADSTYFPGFTAGVQIPTGAKFGYNIQHAAEASLRAVFPMLPPENAQFSQAGSILYSETVVTNEYGIWWMTDAYGTAPWPVDYGSTGIAADVVLWTARLAAEAAIVESVATSIYNELSAGGLAQIGVTRIKPSGALGVAGTAGNAVDGYYGVTTLTNTGATGVKSGGGVSVGGTAGSGTLWKGDVTVRNTAARQAQFLYNKYSAPQISDLQLVTTNGVPSGVSIDLYGHGLGADASDYIDFVLAAGSEFASAEEVMFTTKLLFFVDTATGTPVNKTFRVSYYALNAASVASSTALARSVAVTAQTGRPGVAQVVTIPTDTSTKLSSNWGWLIRITNDTGVSPVPVGTLRVVDVTANLAAL